MSMRMLGVAAALCLAVGCAKDGAKEPAKTETKTEAKKAEPKKEAPKKAEPKKAEAKPAGAESQQAPAAAAAKPATGDAKPVPLVMETSMGTVEMELYPGKAPISVKNFLSYVDDKFYDGTIFHRVIKTFMIQGGGFDQKVQKKATKAPIKNEADNGLKNERGTLAMARTSVVDSATAQFFINVVDNAFLNHRGKNPRTYGYAVFGKVTKGMDVVDKIKDTPTGNCGMFPKDCPKTQVIIKSIRRKG